MAIQIMDDAVEVLTVPAPKIAHVLNLDLDVEKRDVHIYGPIEEETGPWLWKVVEFLGKENIKLHLNTPGGDVDSMFAIHDCIRRHGNFTVYGYGQICSAGVLILACCHKRFVSESTILMSHESTSSSGEIGYRAAKDRRKVEDWQHLWWAELMARYTPMDAKWWRTKTEKTAEYWILGGSNIVSEGIADEIF